MAAKKKTPAQKTWTPQALQALAGAWVAKGNEATPQMAGLLPTPNPAATPYLSGQQTLQKSDAQTAHDQQVQDLQNQLAQAQLNAKYQTQNIEKGRVGGVSNTQDNAAARGIFQSSIKDGQVYDINAQAANDQQRLTDQLTALQSNITTRINMLDEGLRRSMEAFDQMGVENASGIDTGYSPPSGQAPAAPAAAPAAKPKPKAPARRSNMYGGYNSAYGTYRGP